MRSLLCSCVIKPWQPHNLPHTDKLVAHAFNVSNLLRSWDVAKVLNVFLKHESGNQYDSNTDALISILRKTGPFRVSEGYLLAENPGPGFGGAVVQCLPIEIRGQVWDASKVARRLEGELIEFLTSR